MTTRKTLIRSILIDAGKGDNYPLIGLLHWLKYDLGYNNERIADIAYRQFALPHYVTYNVISEFEPQLHYIN